MMASNDHKLKVEGLPPGINKKIIKFLFQNRQWQGGGRVEDVDLQEITHSAIITFYEKEAVDIVFSHGNSVITKGVTCKISRILNETQQEGCYNAASNSSQSSPPATRNNPPVLSKTTLEIDLKDVTKPLETYVIHLQSKVGSGETFDTDKIFMDVLKKTLYVPFHKAEVAQTLCQEDSKSEIFGGIRIARNDVYDHYKDMLSIHGMDFRGKETKLKNYVRMKTNLTPCEVIIGEEPRSAILVFKEVAIYPMAWKCVGKLDGVQLFTAPVKYCPTLRVSITGNIDMLTAELYLKQKNRSGGGPISSCVRERDGSLVVTYERLEDALSVHHKVDHSVSGMTLTTTQWHHCLSIKAFAEFLKLEQGLVSEEENSCPDVSPQHYVLLKKSGFINELSEEYDDVKIKTDDKEHKFILTGSSSRFTLIMNRIARHKLNFVTETLTGLHQKKLNFLQEKRVQEEINKILDGENMIAHIFSEHNKIQCVRDKMKTKLSDIETKVEKACILEVHREDCVENFMALNCDEGRKYISNFTKDYKFPLHVEIISNDNAIEIMLVDMGIHLLHSVLYVLTEYMKNHKVETKVVPFPDLQLKYAKKFMQELDPAIQKLKSRGALVQVGVDKIDIKGNQAVLQDAEQIFSAIRGKITVQEEIINFFGIMEYFESGNGRELLNKIGDENKCLIRPVKHSSFDGVQPNLSQDGAMLIGTSDVEGLQVQVMFGDITSINVDVIVNPVDSRMELKQGIGKAILKKGGRNIKKQLDIFGGRRDCGVIIPTDGGNLPCTTIFHLILNEVDTKPTDILTSVIDCLRNADQGNYKSIALPVVGCGRFQVSAFAASKSITEGVERFARMASSINKIIICDNDWKLLKKTTGTFPDFHQIRSFDDVQKESAANDDVNDDNDSSQDCQRDRGRSACHNKEKFGPITVTYKHGNIIEEKCDVIVSGIKDDLDLTSGGAVSKTLSKKCGSALQTECTQKAEEFEQSGVVTTSAHGLSCSAIIFVSMNKFSRSWNRGVMNVLQLANLNGHSSIALPALGTGSRRADIPRLKGAILRGIKSFANKSTRPTLKDIRLVIFDKKILAEFQKEKDSHSDGVEAGTQDPLPSVSRSVKLQVVHQLAGNGMKAVKELKEKLVVEFLKTSLSNDAVTDISERELQSLVAKGLNKCVEVKRETGCISVGGFNHSTMLEMQQEVHNLFSVIKERHHMDEVQSIKTAFKWQFMRNGRWSDFNPGDNINIEKAYKNCWDHCDIEDTNGRKYRIDFKSMKELRIREEKVSELTTVNRYDLEAEAEQLPKNWMKMNEDNNVMVVPVPNTSSEYKEIESYFNQCGATETVKQIDRIQNLVLYQQYAAKRKCFQKSNPEGTENEKRLFHGTDPNAIANINESGFNRSFCGKNATVYGNGVYFAEESSYSVRYARANESGNKMMYLARVLVGESTPSKVGMTYLPNKPGKNVPFDSGRGPKMYVIFHDTQAYPEYLITF